ncbi:PREDICTED: uncharacterized protein LOC109148648 [Ipomoea nil]|uniref:uncharacterized protein LOC109148648 n=1 Tax=Ipomoea nil TaxID=35883 RepID=UPI000901F05B|nr:PREDICTED: uncharacterized protein LOC109148648 [Ipomoea nil]
MASLSCLMSRSIKYLFKYVNKGHDRVTAEFYKANCDAECPKVIDEISMFYDFWYISPCEASWRLFGFDIQLRTPAVERLSFHLPNQQSGVFADDDPVDNILSRPTILQSMLLEWDACSARGLVDDDREYVHAIEEASQWATGVNLRRLFVTLLMSNSMGKPEVVWEAAWHYLAKDAQFKISAQLRITDLILSEDEKKNFALHEIQIMLSAMGKSLKDFPLMPNDKLVHQLTEEQRDIYGEVLQDAENNLGGLFFVYGYVGTGKTFLWRALSSALRSKGDIVLNVASSGIASLLLPGGRTAHSRFSIPIAVNEDSTCNISQSSPLAQLIMQSKLIIWDEAPMMHKFCFEALDCTMRDIMRAKNPKSLDMTFGGKTVVLGGDFRQILPVIPKGTRQELLEQWIANIGDGTIGDCLHGEYRAILAPTLDIVDAVNEYMNDYNNAEGRTYLSCDSVCKSDSNVDMLADLHTAEFLNGLRCSGVPNHSLTLKVSSPVMLLRNIDHSLGLCNSTRMIISKLADHVLEAQILCGASAGTKVLIPMMSLTPSDARLPFKFQRKQFPLMLSYAMIINKSQGQTLSNVGLFLKRPVFNHGQMYVAVSRVSNPKGLKILIWDETVKSKNTTTNVVYKEVFNNV